MSVDDVVKAIDAIDAADPERAHGQFDALMLGIMPDAIKDAADRLVARCDWWASA